LLSQTTLDRDHGNDILQIWARKPPCRSGCGGGVAERPRQTLTVAARLLSQEHHVKTLKPLPDLRPRSKFLFHFLTIKRLRCLDETASSRVQKSHTHKQTPVAKTRSIGVWVWMARPSPTSTCLHH
jgi:hypothetical protein